MATRQLTGRPLIAGAFFWFMVLLGVLVLALVAFLVVGGSG
jgi:hypothetical protein